MSTVYLGFLLSLLWLVVYGGASWLTSLHAWRVRLHLDADLSIPFCPYASWLYLSLMPMLWIAPLMVRSAEQMRRFAKSLAWCIVLSGLGFVAAPGQSVHSRPDGQGIAFRLCAIADWVNLDHNFFPSLHVGLATACAIAYGRHGAMRRRCLIGIWGVGIAASTLLLHEHYLVDVLGGALLGWAVSVRRGKAGV